MTSNIYPKDILEASTPFATLARVAAYGRPQWTLDHSTKNPIPRIAHYVCIDCEVRFITFLSMRSAVNVAGLNKVRRRRRRRWKRRRKRGRRRGRRGRTGVV